MCARIGFSIASVRPAEVACARAGKNGNDRGDAVIASAGVVSVARTPGYNGQVMGALKPGDVSCSIRDIMAQ